MNLFQKIAITVPVFLLLGAGCTLPGAGSDLSNVGSTAFDLILLDMDGKELGELAKQHTVGKKPCPDPFPPFTIESAGGEVKGPGVAKTDAKWLYVPDTVEIGEPIELKFNCDIDDLSPHAEEGEVIFEFGDGGTEQEPSPTHDLPLGESQRMNVKLKVKMEICNVGQLCGPSLES